MTTNTSFAPQGSVNLVDLRYSITQTRTNFTRPRGNSGRAQSNEPLPDFITLTSLICDIYRRHGDDLAPICQIQSSKETQYNKGHTSTVSHTKIPGLRVSKVSDDTLNTQSQTLIVKRPRQSILEEQSYALISFITELRIRTHSPLRDHPSIARFRGICWDFEDEEATIPRPLLLEELAPQGALDNFWQRWNFVRMNFKPKLDMCRDVAEGLLALHHCGIVHGDVKPENLLVFPRPNGKDEFMVKLTDFGHSVFEHNRLNALPAFTPQWCAPEATKATAMSFNDMIATDCYSYGLVTLSVMIGRPFHVDMEDVETYKQGDTLLTKAVDIIEKEDRKNTDSDLNLDVIRRLLNHTVQLNIKRRNLKRCLSIIKRYNEIYGHSLDNFYGHHTSYARPLAQMKVSEMVIIGYQTLSRTSHQLKKHLTSALLRIASDTKDPRKMSCAWELAVCYYSGFGVPVSFPDCLHWLSVASKGGVVVAQNVSQSLCEAMQEEHTEPLRGVEIASLKTYQLPQTISEQVASESAAENAASKIHSISIDETEYCSDNDNYEGEQVGHRYDTRTLPSLPDRVSQILHCGAVKELQEVLNEDHLILNSQNDEGNTLLFLAAKLRNADLFEFLVSQPNIDASICNKLQRTILHELALLDGSMIRSTVPRLIARGADIYHEALPRSSETGLTFSFGIRCDSLLNCILVGNLTLLECLLEACHLPGTKVPCRMCEAGSHFRRTLAISLSILRADAIELLVEHVKTHRSTKEIDLSRIEVWAGQELLPLYKVPFNSVVITAMDLPESLFRAINYGAKHNVFLERTIRFLLTTAKDIHTLAYSILGEAVSRNNVYAIYFLLQEGRARKFPRRWWVNGPYESWPILKSIELGYREAYETFLKDDPSFFSACIELPCSTVGCSKNHETQWSYMKRILFGLKRDSGPAPDDTHKIYQVQTALDVFVESSHKDKYFLNSILDKSHKSMVTVERPKFFEYAVLNSSFDIATTVATRFPEIWTHAKSTNGKLGGNQIVHTSLGLWAPDMISQILVAGSYEQCQFVFKQLFSQRKSPSAKTRVDKYRQGDGIPEWMRCTLTNTEYNSLLLGSIETSRADRHTLWDVIGEQVTLGHSTSASYLRLAIRRGNVNALEQMLSRGWNSNGAFWLYFSTPLQYCQALSRESVVMFHIRFRFNEIMLRLNPDLPQDEWIHSSMHATIYKAYQKRLDEYHSKEWKSRNEKCQEILLEHGGRVSPLVTYFSQRPETALLWLTMLAVPAYFLVLPLCLVYLTSNIWLDISHAQKFVFAYIWAPLTFFFPFVPVGLSMNRMYVRSEKAGGVLFSALFIILNHFVVPTTIIRLNWKPLLFCSNSVEVSGNPICTDYSYLFPLVVLAIESWISIWFFFL